MTITGFFDNMLTGENAPIKGMSLAGTINIEKGFIEVSSDYFGDCAECSSGFQIIRNCDRCGRSEGNNFNFLAGRGDGVYSGIEFLGERKSSIAYLFDENNQFASEVGNKLSEQCVYTEWGEVFFPLCEKYFELPCLDGGTLKVLMGAPEDRGILIGGSGGFSDLSAAAVDHPTTTGLYRVLIFVEPDDKEKSPAGNALLRPRLLLLVPDEDFETFSDGVTVYSPDWEDISKAWGNSVVASNMGAPNGAVAYYFNGIHYANQLKHLGESYSLEASHNWNYILWLRAFGYFWLGMALGDEDCLLQYLAMFKAVGGFKFVDFQVYKTAGKTRGLSVTEEHWSDFKKLIYAQIIAGNLR
jgi:hypothetical protein